MCRYIDCLEIIRILTALSYEVRKDLPKLLESEKILAEIDFHFAKARYATRIGAIEPEICDNKIIEFVAKSLG